MQLAATDLLAGAAELGVELSAEQADQLVRFAALLVRWNAVHNLTAIDSPAGILSHHLLDSLAILPSLALICSHLQCKVLDVGSGGGLPGIPLAIARPPWRVTVVDKVQKKAAFLLQAKLELGLSNLDCLHARVEDVRTPPFDLIVSRAFSSLADFVRVSAHLLAPGGWWAAMKGTHPKDELAGLAGAMPDVRVVDVVKLAIPRLAAERHLILLQRN
ncbi:MAG: 16S rRNA (guanine(527)-N(7))-methyltransferase RsmG [Betaproteobacteria bacterium]